MKISFRSPSLWISATVLSSLMYLFAFHFFPQTFPLIHLNITMDLEQALDTADVIAQKYNLGPDGYEYAAMFHTNNTVKTFVELEAGGKDAFVEMMEKKLYMPYTWQIRHFKEHEKNEVTIRFTPDGTPYGFIETISENDPGEQLSSIEARKIAENDITEHWNVNFNNYTLVETSQKTELSGRIDHILVYERIDQKIGDGLYRLKVVVSGDKTTELTHFVKVPEAFNRRYAEMRSANNTIAWAATIVMALLYLLCGCGVGLFLIIKQRWNIIKQPLQWAAALAFMAVLASVNQLPFLWMYYNTAQSSNGFLIQLFLRFLRSLLSQTAFLTIIIMTAEGLTRRAFGHQPQLWSLWRSDVITSYAMLGRTFGGYLLVGFNCAFVIGFYLFSSRYLGWWSPSEMLFDPNILATYVPWFSPIAQSLNAGFMEECLFRAIPLAGAALLGSHFGKKNWWIGCAFILQAIVFGAAHANYPVQPSYARLVELLIPSLIWGATYLQFGLLPTIIAHSVYDIIWFSLPIFVSHAPHAFAYKITIALITLLPLILIAYARIQKGKWTNLPESALNESWLPTTIIEQKTEPIIIPTQSCTLSTVSKKIVISLGLLGLIVWICTTPFTHDGVTITLNKNDAITVAHTYLEQNNVILNNSWKTLPLIFTHYNLIPQIAAQHKFIWREGNKELYHNLLGNYLQPAHWTIRYAQFDSDIIDRAEERKIMLYNDAIWRSYHQLPETTPGAQLTQNEARTIAHKALQQQCNLDPTNVKEISATQGQLPNRRDWLFIFLNEKIYPLQTGQARINITIAGDEVVDIVRMIHVPEEWERNEHNKQNTLGIIAISFFLILMFFILFAMRLAFKRERRFNFSKPLFLTLFSIAVILLSIEIINTWPSIVGAFNTSTPLINQLFQSITGLALNMIVKAILYAIIITYIIKQKKTHQLPMHWITIGMGISVGLFFAGIFAWANTVATANMPLWPRYESLGCSIPLLNSLINAITHYTQLTMAFSLLCILITTATQQWQKHRLLFTIFAGLCGISMFELPSIDALSTWIIVGTTIGWLLLTSYQCIIRYDYSLIPLATGSFIILQIIQQALFNAYPGAIIASIISSCTVGLLSGLWYWSIHAKE